MHMPGFWSLIIVLGLAFLLFGRPGRLSSTMEDLGKGIRGFRKGLSDTEAAPTTTPPPASPTEPPRQVPDQNASTNQDRVQS